MTDKPTSQQQMHSNIHRFSNRAELYEKFRPGYPDALYHFLQQSILPHDRSVIADLAAGTGIFTRPMLVWPNPLYLIEPNPDMLQIARDKFVEFPSLRFQQGRAEHLDLPDHSIDLFTIAQAFHWLDPLDTKRELLRVGKEGAQVAIIWNYRQLDQPFAQAYESFIEKYATDYEFSSQKKMNVDLLDDFFFPAQAQIKEWDQTDLLDWETIWGRTLSYSYFPEPVGAKGVEMEEAFKRIFDQFQVDEKVCLHYTTKLYVGPLLPR
jgi:ubiquinone/menaquinone biosynthesis C-methylase UbiE